MRERWSREARGIEGLREAAIKGHESRNGEVEEENSGHSKHWTSGRRYLTDFMFGEWKWNVCAIKN